MKVSARMKFWYALAMVFVSVFTVMIVSIIYTNHVAAASRRAAQHAVETSQQQMCTILVPISAAYNQPPPNDPKSDIGKQLAREFALLVKNYRCQGG